MPKELDTAIKRLEAAKTEKIEADLATCWRFHGCGEAARAVAVTQRTAGCMIIKS